MTHERRVLALTLLSGAPALVVAVTALAYGDYSTKLVATLVTVSVVAWLLAALAARDEAVRPLQTLANLLLSLREGDFTVRGKQRASDDAGALAISEVNALAQLLQTQRTAALEATTLLHKVLDEIDIAILAVDAKGEVRMLNPAAERFEGNVQQLLTGEPVRMIESWELRRRSFRQQGQPHTLLVLTDLRRALREEERLAWQRLVRVLGHEIGNSLAPIQSLAGSLRSLVTRQPEQWQEKALKGLEIVERRSEALNRFMQSYTKLTRLPAPVKKPLQVEEWLPRIARLHDATLTDGPPATLLGDADQLDQVLINLTKNAIEAGGKAHISWRVDSALHVLVEDDGPGVAETTSLFVPFFTTKPDGSGIGLALSRQIVEAHGGTLELANRTAGPGAVARITLPLGA